MTNADTNTTRTALPSKYTVHAERKIEVPRHEEFGLADRFGRAIGATAFLSEDTFEGREGEPRGAFYRLAPGVWFRFMPWATRNGKNYGAVQADQWFATREERETAIAKYFVGARKRAAKIAVAS